MRFGFFVSLLVFIGVVFSQACDNSVEIYLDTGEDYKYVSFTLDKEYFLFSINDKYSMLASCDKGAVFLKNPESIEGVLNGYSNSVTAVKPDKQAIDQLKSKIKEFEGSRRGEEECERYTGVDRFPCNDRESCIASCYTPMCNDMKHGTGCEIGGEGCEFIDSIAHFSISLEILDNKTGKLNSVLDEVDAVEDVSTFNNGINVIDELVSVSEGINTNPLMKTIEEKGYYFCPKVDYKTDSLLEIREELVRIRNVYSLVTGAKTTAEYISEETQRRMELKKNIDRCLQYKNYTLEYVGKIENSTHPVVNYSEVKKGIQKMHSTRTQILQYCNSRNFSKADSLMNSFEEEGVSTQKTLSNISAEYDTVKILYNEVWDELTGLPPERNTTGVYESMRMVERELGIVHNMSDLMVLRKVLLENREEMKVDPGIPGISVLEWLLYPVMVAAVVTAALYYVVRRNKRKGL